MITKDESPEQLATRMARRRKVIHAADSDNIRDAYEGPQVSALLWVFKQLERKGIGKKN